MKTASKPTLSTVSAPSAPAEQQLKQHSIQILTFIHRFRHVTSQHVQINLGLSSTSSTHYQLSKLVALGLIARQYTDADKGSNRPASYYLTERGKNALKTYASSMRLRDNRSINHDASMSAATKARYHVLANTYYYYKRHFNGKFEFFTAFDLSGVDNVPERLPDGYVRRTNDDGTITQYFVEIYGRGRSTMEQVRRLSSYIHYAEEHGYAKTEPAQPKLLVITGSKPAERRLHSQIKKQLEDSMVHNWCVFTTIEHALLSASPVIWRELYHS